MTSFPSGTVTFLFTDMEGSTRLAREHPKTWEALRARHHAILREAIESNNGYIFQIIGDAFCAAFHTAEDAVRAAAKSQIDLHSETWGETPIKVRMGIHTGKAEIQEEGQYHGYLAMSRIQRLMSAGHGGQVLISAATQELLLEDLPEEVSLRDLGERRLKDLIRPEHIYQLVVPGLPVDFPPLKTLDAYRHNLPVQMTSFVGRGKEIEEIKQSVLTHRLVTLTGVGGTGKTRLSLQVAADSLDQFPDGVWFVELAALTDPSIIPGTILSAAGVPEQRGMTVQQLLLDYLREKKLLLMLDNCEHLIEACARLTGTLLSNSPALNILATSREALGVAGEMIWQVPSLSLPDVKQLSNTEQLSQYEAVQLFVERATLVQPHFNVTNENAPAVAQICFRLDGIPLAIELAAARVRALSVDQISKRLDDRFRLLTGGSRTALERHQTLRAALDWSYNLLSPEEKVLLGRLSVFTGGWTLEAAEQVCDWGDGEFDVLDFLTQLVEKSLVNANVLGNDTRYSMLETTRQYAREKLFDSNEGESLHNRHAEYFLILAGKADQQVHGPYQLEWINRFEAEHDNLRAAFEWSLAAKQTENAVRLFNCIHWAWHLRGHFSEMSEWFEKIDTLPDIEAFPLQYARTLTNAASWEWLQGKLMEARSHLTQSRSICMELGVEGEAELAWALTWLAHIGRIQGTDLAEAASLAKDALQLHQKWGNKIGVAFSTFFLGAVQANQGLPSAKQTLEHSLELFHQLGDSWGIARASQLLGSTYLETGDFEKAKKYFERHLFLDETSDFKAGICAALDDLAHLYRAQGDFIQAKQFFQKSIQLAQDYGILPSYSLYGLSMIALAQNDYESALSLFTELFDRAKTQAASDLLMGLAAISAGLGQPERSATLYGAAQLIMDTSDYKYSPYDMTEFERHIQLAREQLGNARFEALAAEGRLMTMEQAIELALERSDG